MFKKIIAGTSLLFAANFANAAIIEQSVDVMPMTTNFDLVVSFDKFDDMAGTRMLDSVTVSLDGLVEGAASVESLDAKATRINATLGAELSLTGPLGRLLATSIPSVTNSFNASAFDGIIDFAGSSGTVFSGLGASEFASITLTDVATLTFFSGMGMADFNFAAFAQSRVTGAGNIISQLNTRAGGEIKVVYEYTNVVKQVSSPASLALLGLALLGLASSRRFYK